MLRYPENLCLRVLRSDQEKLRRGRIKSGPKGARWLPGCAMAPNAIVQIELSPRDEDFIRRDTRILHFWCFPPDRSVYGRIH